MMALFLIALALLQDKTIPYSDRAPYLQAVADCEKARTKITSDPRAANRMLTGIIDNDNIKIRERRIRIERKRGEFTKYYGFYPYQYRGRARMRQSDKTDDTETALNFLRRAIRDLEHSEKLGLASSKRHLKLAREKYKRRGGKPPESDPETEFRKEWQRFLDEDRFVEARDFVQKKLATFLTREKRSHYLEETKKACRQTIHAATRAFLNELAKIDDPIRLQTMSEVAFRNKFRLPDKGRLTLITNEYSWCGSVRETLQRLRKREDALDRLFDHGVSSVGLTPAAKSRWFLSIEQIAFPLVRDEIGRLAREARNATSDQRATLKSNATKLKVRWKRFDERVRRAGKNNKEFLAGIPRHDFAALFEAFPVESDGINKIIAALLNCPKAANPETAVAAVQKSLADLRKNWNRLPVESRKAIVKYQIAAGAIRGFLNFKTAAQVAQDLRDLGGDLRGLGGKSGLKRFGPKVEAVFKILLG